MHLAVDKEVSLPTQNYALNPLAFYALFGYMKVIEAALTILSAILTFIP